MSDREISKFKNEFDGKRIFILGNGPSLSDTPLEKLNDEYTLGMNKISHIYTDTNWRPDFYYYAEPPTADLSPDNYSNGNFIKESVDMDIPCFLCSEWEKYTENSDNVYYFDKFHLGGVNPFHQSSIEDVEKMKIRKLTKFWSDDIEQFIYHYHSMYGALQVANYLGFEKIYLLGCDLGMEYQNPHMIFDSGLDPHRYRDGKIEYLKESAEERVFFQSIVNAAAIMLIKNLESSILEHLFSFDTNDHFTPNYRSLNINDGEKFEKEIIKSHHAAKGICEEKSTNIYNATVGGELEVYERVGLERIV